MDAAQKNSTALFDVYLRLRPPTANPTEPFLEVDDATSGPATHITIKPPLDDHRKRAVEKFAFTKVFSEDATQLDIFNNTNLLPMVEGVLGADQKPGRDGLLATLGVTGSGKTHTILGSKQQRGLTQLTLNILFKSIGSNLVQSTIAVPQLAAIDVSEAVVFPAQAFLESIYSDGDSRAASRAQTPLQVSTASNIPTPRPPPLAIFQALSRLNAARQDKDSVKEDEPMTPHKSTSKSVDVAARLTRSVTKVEALPIKEPPTSSRSIYTSLYSHKRHMPSVAALPRVPNIDDIHVASDPDAEYALVVSMYEVYNDRIFDLLTGTAMNTRFNGKEIRRRALLFKNTEWSHDQKVVCGLRKVVCGSLEEALLVLETGLTERRVAGTGTNAFSSRSHGFFCVEVKKRNRKSRSSTWNGCTLTIVDLAGSERARTAKTTGSTLAEAGKINESLMYLGQVMQMQSSSDEGRSLVPIRHCKLTELLFTNSFHSQGSAFATSSAHLHNTRARQQFHNYPSHNQHHYHRPQRQQKAVMIVTADPSGDFNATSQILRYSALAREVTVPRIPSVTSTIMCGATPGSRPQTANSSFTSEPSTSIEDLSKLTSELAVVRLQLEEETRRRREAESSWAKAEERLEEVEAEVREECWAAFEGRLRLERERWAGAWEEERERTEGHLDSKLGLLVRGLALDGSNPSGGIGIYEDGTVVDNNNKVEQLERENEILRDKVNGLEREMSCARTPSRKVKVLKARKWNVDAEDGDDVENFSPF